MLTRITGMPWFMPWLCSKESYRGKSHKLSILSCVGVFAWLRKGFGLDLLHLIHSHSSGLQAIQCYCYSTHFPVHRCTCTRILSLHLIVTWQLTYQSHWYFKSHVKSSCHSLTHFLPLFCSCQFWRLDYSLNDFLCPCITPWQGPHVKHSLYVKEACVLVLYLAVDVLLMHVCVARMCLPSRCLAVGIHTTIFSILP
jgi:hypothetical protein